MTKLIAVLNVIAWSGFWAFGFIALTSDPADTRTIMIATSLAAIGGGFGVFAFLRCTRYCEETGYMKRANRAVLVAEAA